MESAVEVAKRWLTTPSPKKGMGISFAEVRQIALALIDVSTASAKAPTDKITSVTRAFDFDREKQQHTPWVMVCFPPNDWESRDAFAASLSHELRTERAQSEPMPPAEHRGSCGIELRGRPLQEGASTQAPHSQAGSRVEASAPSSTRPPMNMEGRAGDDMDVGALIAAGITRAAAATGVITINNIERFSTTEEARMRRDPDGDWVLFEDAAAISNRLASQTAAPSAKGNSEALELLSEAWSELRLVASYRDDPETNIGLRCTATAQYALAKRISEYLSRSDGGAQNG